MGGCTGCTGTLCVSSSAANGAKGSHLTGAPRPASTPPREAGQLLIVHTAADVEKCRGDGGRRRHRCRAVGRAAAEALARAAGGHAIAHLGRTGSQAGRVGSQIQSQIGHRWVTDRHPAGPVHNEPRGRAGEDARRACAHQARAHGTSEFRCSLAERRAGAGVPRAAAVRSGGHPRGGP
eukprot:scaffold74700_cov60-Phaeocystis_antarctica.AAC.2